MRHTGEQWALEAGEGAELEWCPVCEEWMGVTWDGECVGCGFAVDDESEDGEAPWTEDRTMEREHDNRGPR